MRNKKPTPTPKEPRPQYVLPPERPALPEPPDIRLIDIKLLKCDVNTKSCEEIQDFFLKFGFVEPMIRVTKQLHPITEADAVAIASVKQVNRENPWAEMVECRIIENPELINRLKMTDDEMELISLL